MERLLQREKELVGKLEERDKSGSTQPGANQSMPMQTASPTLPKPSNLPLPPIPDPLQVIDQLPDDPFEFLDRLIEKLDKKLSSLR